VANVIWCTGSGPDFSWIDLPVFGDREHEPVHHRGVVASQPGLYFVGLSFLYAMSSGFLPGVDRDAEHVVQAILAGAGRTADNGARRRRQPQRHPTARRHQVAAPLPIVLVPGLLTSPRLFSAQLPAVWRHGPVTIADNTRDDTIAAIASRILAHAPPRFALAGLSMGGYISLEIVRQAPDRIDRLALLDTSARPDTTELTERRQAQIALARGGRFAEIADQQFPLLVHPSRHGDPSARDLVRLMADETGPDAFIRQQQAIMGRVDSRPGLGAIDRPTLVLVGDSDQLTPPELSAEIAGSIPGARLVVVAGAGHLSTLDQPEQVTRALVAWLQA
jgi:pimeloyl-ACP methyl ester carboxylesterase